MLYGIMLITTRLPLIVFVVLFTSQSSLASVCNDLLRPAIIRSENTLTKRLQPLSNDGLFTELEFRQTMMDKKVPEWLAQQMVLLNLPYVGFDGFNHIGQMAIHMAEAENVKKIFTEIFAVGFPIEKMRLISIYDWSDIKSIEDNNSSGFCTRMVKGSSEVSDHACATAIDLNPKQNKNEPVNYPDSTHDPSVPGTLYTTSIVVRIFKKYGWQWGGYWQNMKDRMHFYAPHTSYKYFEKIEVYE